MNLNVKSQAGWCLFFVQEVYGVPHLYRSAFDAYKATKFKHTTALPNYSVPVWFEHWGTYGTPPTYGNWGHVVAYVPGKGFLSAPGTGYGQQWFKSILEIEKYFNAKYVGWSEDISGVTLKGDDMVTDKAQLSRMYDAILRRSRTAGEGENVYLNKDSGFVFDDLYKSVERAKRLASDKAELKTAQDKAVALTKSVADLTNRLDKANKEIASLKNITSGDTELAKDTNAKVTWIQNLLNRLFK